MADVFFAGNRGAAEDFYLRQDEFIMGYNRLYSYGYNRGLAERVIELEMYFGGRGFHLSSAYLYGMDYPRLLSYSYRREMAEAYVLNKRWEAFMREFALFLAGDSSGFPDMVPEKLIKEYDVLLSYIHPSGPKGVDKIGEVKRGGFMDLFLVGPEKEVIMQEVTGNTASNMLFNYIDGQKATDKYAQQIKPKKLFIDSGAYSAWTKGKVIDVDEYIDWINARADYIDLYGQIDVIPGDKELGATSEQVQEAARLTWENYLYMRQRMKKPEGLLYTFHVGEPYDYLRDALEWRDDNGALIPYIALGGMVGKPMPVKRSFLDTCFRIIKKSSNPNVKVHAFGMTSMDLLQTYPITSADSTSWIMTGANGNIMTDFGIIAVSDQMAKLPEHYSHLSQHLQDQFEQSLSEFGFTLDELRHSRDKRIMFNARYMHKRISNLEYKPGPKRQSLF